VQPGLYAMSMDTEESLKEYLSLQLKVPSAREARPAGPDLRLHRHRGPGVKEILTVGKLTYEVREQHYDLVVVDASATGHVVGQLAAPQADQRARARSGSCATRPTG
jgi:anion-transporting  ArsA/GET3 family ATPase